MSQFRFHQGRHAAAVLLLVSMATPSMGQLKNPVLNSVYPPGAQAGTSVEVTVSGADLAGASAIVCNCPGISFRLAGESRFVATIAAGVPTGQYDVRAVGSDGVSSTRAFVVGTHPEQIETQPDNEVTPQVVPLNSVANGRIEKNGDVDAFRFEARAGDHLILECRAERIDSRLRAVLELYDSGGRRVATSRGYFGIDPLIDYRVPSDGAYTIQISDRTYTGSNDHFYRLSIDAGPRALFAVPSTVVAGSTARVVLYGWNLSKSRPPLVATADANVAKGEFGVGENNTSSTSSLSLPSEGSFDRVEVEITAPNLGERLGTPVLLRSAQASLEVFPYRFPGSDEPVPICLSDISVVLDNPSNQSPQTAQAIQSPAEVCGQLKAGDERDWYAFDARRGEVFWLDAFGQRLGAPVDLDVSIFDIDAKTELAAFHDEVQNIAGRRFPTNHLDPSGRWVAPHDGRFLVVVRNVIGGLDSDPRRCYRLSVRREEPGFDIVVLPGLSESPAGLNVPHGGRAIAEVIALRHRGMHGAIQIRAENLPAEIDCPDIWLGPDVDHAPLIVSARSDAAPGVSSLQLLATAEQIGSTAPRVARGGVSVGGDAPNGSGRLTSDLALAVAGQSPVRLTAMAEHEKCPQGSIVNIAVDIERPARSVPAVVNLTGLLLPESIDNQTSVIAAGASRGYISFRLPKEMAPGKYTLAVRGDTALTFLPAEGASTAPPPTSHVLYSNPVTFEVFPAPYILSVDLNAPKKLKRGAIMQLNYAAHRQNGFIGKIHTDLFAPGGVVGIRGRGVTFVGQVETGVIQVVASDDAPLGPLKFLQLEGLGTVEDNPIYRVNCFVELEITN